MKNKRNKNRPVIVSSSTKCKIPKLVHVVVVVVWKNGQQRALAGWLTL